MQNQDITKKRQKKRKEAGIYKVNNESKKPKFYVLDMFPYPSGAGLHVGHPKGYIATDVLSRKKMLEGYNVLHPMGFDTFGLGTENYAIQNKVTPQKASADNIAIFKDQLEKFGFTYDLDREFSTADPNYYKWTQRIFLKFYTHYYDEVAQKAKPIEELEKKIRNGEIELPITQSEAKSLDSSALPQNDDETFEIKLKKYLDSQRLAYIDYKPINRCPNCKTGLANEDLDDGKCERCAGEVEQKPMRQWVLRITKYAERLIEGLDGLDWEESMKELERNWIGKSEGTQFKMQLKDSEENFEVYTTRVDTVFGMSFVVMAPEHHLVEQITTPEYAEAVKKYQEQAKHKTQLERTELQKEKTGQFTWAYAINPFNNEEIPVYIGDYVLANYGTGVVMAVPAHDERDFDFAKKYGIKITQSIAPVKDTSPPPPLLEGEVGWGVISCYPEKWILVNSWAFTGLTSDEAISKMQERLAENNLWGKKTNYKIQDWVFSRQRYWGEPFPVLFDENKNIIPMDEKDLPLELPKVENYAPTGTEEGPLADIKEWIEVEDPETGKTYLRESNTMPGWAGSSRYWLRYMDPSNDEALVGKQANEYRRNVDVYVGGAEHVTRHMIYARFWQNFLYDLGVVCEKEPFKKYHKVGLIMGSDGRKMSKRRGNVINPDDVIAEHGTDALRVYEMFMWPFNQAIDWNTSGVKGVKKFLDKITALKEKVTLPGQNRPPLNPLLQGGAEANSSPLGGGTPEWNEGRGSYTEKCKDTPETLHILHTTIKKVTEDIDAFGFNTAISQLMILVNHLSNLDTLSKASYEILLQLIAPFAPHLAEELWEQIGNGFSIFTTTSRPQYDEKHLKQSTVKIAVQFNGKVRGTLQVDADISQDDFIATVQADDHLAKYFPATPKKIIFIPGKICNIVG